MSSSERYDMEGQLLSFGDDLGQTVTITRDANGRATVITPPSGRTLELEYNATGQVVTLFAGGTPLAVYEYDTHGVSKVRYPDGSGFTYSYDPWGQIVQVADLSGRIVELHTYDTSGRALTSASADGRDKYTLTYDSLEQKTTVVDALGNATIYRWASVHALRRVTQIEGPCQGCGGGGTSNEAWQYDDMGRIVGFTDVESRTSTYTYDAQGKLITAVNPDLETTTYIRDTEGRVTEVNSPGGIHTAYTYGPAGVLSVTHPLNRTTSMTYTPQGRLATVQDARGKTTNFSYNTAGDLVSITDPLNHTTTFGHDALGRRTTVTDPLGHTTTTAHDSRGRVSRITNHDGTHTDFLYDFGGRRTGVSDPLGRTTHYIHDPYGRLEAVLDPMNGTTRYDYDLMGNLLSLTDAKRNTTTFEYDAYGRMKKTIYPGGTFETFTYDTGSQIATKMDGKGITTTYSYDTKGRLIGKSYSDGTSPPVTYTYDAAGRLATAANGTDTLSWVYDLAGQVLSEQSAKNGSTVSYTYDTAGNRLTLSLDESLFVSYGYDDAGRLSTITRGANVFSFAYDNGNRRTSMSFPNGINTAYTYDTLSRLTRLKADFGAIPITDFQYTYDSAGNRSRKQQLDYAEDYSYDALHQLIGVERSAGLTGIWHWGYDPVGNRTTTQFNDSVLSSSYSERNQLTSRNAGGTLMVRGTLNEAGTAKVNGDPARMLAPNVFEATLQVASGTNTFAVEATDQSGNVNTKSYQVSVSATGATYSYDLNGNLVQTVDGADTWTYEWTPENELKRVRQNGVEQARFAYDPLGRRVEKVSGAVSTSYTYNRRYLLREIRGSSTPSLYVLRPKSEETLAKESAGQLSYYHTDGLASVVKTTTAAGAVILTTRYDAFGNPETTGLDGAAFTGREWDPEVKLYYYRARYYDAGIGRFISEDPTGRDGGLNFYRYVSNRPATLVDPDGLYELIGFDNPGESTDIHMAIKLIIETLNQKGLPCCAGDLKDDILKYINDPDLVIEKVPNTTTFLNCGNVTPKTLFGFEKRIQITSDAWTCCPETGLSGLASVAGTLIHELVHIGRPETRHPTKADPRGGSEQWLPRKVSYDCFLCK